jgi:hypothetical protein
MPRQGGRGQGRGRGQRQGMQSGMGSGRNGEGGGLGRAGFCICPKCGQRFPHQPGSPCLDERCPNCGVAMVREGSPHHVEIENRRAARETES